MISWSIKTVTCVPLLSYRAITIVSFRIFGYCLLADEIFVFSIKLTDLLAD